MTTVHPASSIEDRFPELASDAEVMFVFSKNLINKFLSGSSEFDFQKSVLMVRLSNVIVEDVDLKKNQWKIDSFVCSF